MEVKDVMLHPGSFGQVGTNAMLKEALDKMTESRLGIVCIVSESGDLQGVITDGDIRRKLLRVQKPLSSLFVDDALDHAITKPTTCTENDSLKSAVALMGEKQVWDLPVISVDGKLVGLLHLHAAISKLI